MGSIKKNIFGGLKRCKCCNSVFLMQGYNKKDPLTQTMEEEQICYDCAYWKNIISNPPQYMEVSNGKCIRIFPEVKRKNKTMILGGKGKMKYFIKRDMTFIKSNDVWQIGVIPKIFQEQLPDTVAEVSSIRYERFKNGKNKNRCSARGCLDRYHCIRYRLELENDHIGAYNKVSPGWKPGAERCKFFINSKAGDDSNVGK